MEEKEILGYLFNFYLQERLRIIVPLFHGKWVKQLLDTDYVKQEGFSHINIVALILMIHADYSEMVLFRFYDMTYFIKYAFKCLVMLDFIN